MQIADVRLDQFKDRGAREKCAGQGIYLKVTHDLIVEALAVEADAFQGT
jgi:hypothetical protein